ncbi:MAG: esterase family protein [Mycobacterium sp.]|nr:esterase family protein [Mycobacterium sp.]
MRKSYRWPAVVAAVLIGVLAAPGVAHADTKVAEISKSSKLSPLRTDIWVDSPSMGGKVKVSVFTPQYSSGPRSTVYLLDGADAGEDVSDWITKGKAGKFFADKNVNVVLPTGGAGSFYTNWVQRDAALGKPQWETFLTKELPPLIDAQFNTTGRNAVAGISMAGTTVFNLAIAAPGLYRSVAAFSGCARTSDPVGQQYIRFVTADRGGGNLENMWGPLDGPGWRANDPYLNAEKLRGTKIYMTSGTWLPGTHERLEDPFVQGDPFFLANQALLGGAIEVAIDQCTRQMAGRLAELRIPADVTFRNTGTHSWGYWQDDLHRTWPQIERDLR